MSALDAILRSAGFFRTATLPVTTEGPSALPNHDVSVSAGPYYLVSRSMAAGSLSLRRTLHLTRKWSRICLISATASARYYRAIPLLW